MSCPESKEKDVPSAEIKQITYNEIASKLLRDKLLLTALELHTELVEGGKEIRVLKDFFSNPGNFESQTQDVTVRLSRSGSQVTLDSLDFTRYSEDGGGTDERVAVLEFELRKAKETINALRNNLTVATESETSTPDKGSLKNITAGTIKPHEQRALNFLINEYLLIHQYKLTSITFADENQNQDFDDWDDVGLNISKPPELLTLYREGLKQSGQNCVTRSSQTENEDINKMSEEQNETESELESLKSKLYSLELELSDMKNQNMTLQKEVESLSNQINASPNEKSSKNSVDSDTPDRFEIIDKNSSIFKKQDADAMSNNSLNTSDWTNLCIPFEKTDEIFIKENKTKVEASTPTKEIIIDVDKSKDRFINEIFSMCYIKIPKRSENNDNNEDVFDEIVSKENLIHAISHSLLKIIPNIILNKREEVIPLLVTAVNLNPKPSERDKLLQQLFNLKKRPSEAERLMILSGVIDIAKYSGENLVENEILPQCWLQLTHKYIERRLLVAEACTTLIPYVSSPIRNSLILSMLQQMLEDRDESVRETVVRALALLFALCEDNDKYQQCEQLAVSTLNDSSSGIVNVSSQILFPTLGRWALTSGYLTSNLLKKLLHKLNNCIKDIESPTKVNQSSDRIQRIVDVVENLLPFLLMLIASHENVISNIEKDMAIEIRADFVRVCSNLTNPERFFKSDINSGMILYEFDKYISENPNITWPEMDWVVDIMLPDLYNNFHHIEISQQSVFHCFLNLFSRICIVFGINFTKYKILPFLQKKIQNLEQVISSFNQFSPSLNIIPIYLSALSYSKEFDELSTMLKKFLSALPLCGTPLDCLEIALKRLCDVSLQETVVDCLWSGVVHQRPLVKAATASLFSCIIGVCNVDLLKTKVTGAIVTLASDSDILVRTATIPALGCLITDTEVKEIHDKAYMQLQTYINDSSLKENHTLLRQLIVTMGNIVSSCSHQFRIDVILPQLTSYSVYMSQMSNQTRKVDMALALLEAFTNVVYSPLNKQGMGGLIKPGLKCLETVILENQSLSPHQETILSMVRECDSKSDVPSAQSSLHDRATSGRLSQNVNQGVEEVRQRVSKIFHKPAAIAKPNTLQGIFKKK